MSFFISSRNRHGNIFGHTTQSMAVDTFAQRSQQLTRANRLPFSDANKTIRGTEIIYKTAPGRSGVKDHLFTSNLQQRTIGRDAMFHVREMKRRHEDNPLVKTVETRPVSFSRKDVMQVDKSAAIMDEKRMNMETPMEQKVLPIAIEDPASFGATYLSERQRKIDVKQFEATKNYMEPQMYTEDTKFARYNKNDGPVDHKKRTRETDERVPLHAPVLSNKKFKTTLNPNTILAETRARMMFNKN